MKMLQRGKQLWSSFTVALMLALLPASAFAQCAMCRASLNSSDGAAMAKSLNLGIIVLLIPPVTIFCAIFITAFKYRKAAGDVTKNLP